MAKRSTVTPTGIFQSQWFKRLAGLVIILLVAAWVAESDAVLNQGSSSYDHAPMEESVTMMSSATSDSRSYDYAESESMYYEELGSASYDDALETEARVIKTGAMSIEVKSTQDTLSAITTIAQASGGFVESSYTWLQSDESTAGSIVIRVESVAFEQALEDIRALARVVTSESVSGQDVTEEYIDMQARLSNLEALEQQYLEILDQATTVEELLDVNSYLSNVREDIEVLQGRLNYLENQTDYSTISVSVYEETSLLAPTSDWQPVVVAKEAFNRLVVALQGLVDVAIWAVVFVLPIGILVWLGWMVAKWVYRRRQ